MNITMRTSMKSLLYSTIGELTELSVSHGFEGNLWHTYLTYLMVSHENAIQHFL